MVETLGPSVCEDRPGVTTISSGQQRTARRPERHGIFNYLPRTDG
jgi:hypothetical protein